MLPINSGSFLTSEEIRKTKYEYNKPLIRLCCIAIFVLTAVSCAVMGAAVGYARYTAPKPIVNEAEYAAAQKQANSINKSLAIVRESRPSDLDVCDVISKISNAVALSEITVTNISINDKQFVIKGLSKNIDGANHFVDSLEFDNSKYSKSLSDISDNTSDKVSNMDFTVTILSNIKRGGSK